MDTTGGAKRAADSDQTVDTYAFCQNCMRVSTSLQNCDKCGTQLTSDNLIGSYGAEPKRARTDNEKTVTKESANHVNGVTPSMNGTASPSPQTTASSAAVPVPQALYVNRNAISTTDTPSVRPQAIYMNVNNTTSSARSTPTTASSVDSSAASQTVTLTNSTGSSPALISSTGASNMAASSALNTANTNSMDRSRPALANSTASTFTVQGQPFSGARTPAAGNYPPNAVAPTTNPNPNTISVLPNMVSIPAQQIRIGAQKFKPLTSVQFKDDGILFTLKDYTYAPVLLNARAILKCKANLNLYQYPLFLLYLEGSCMKQIRNIFGLKDDEFASESPCEMKKCITILPAITKESAREMMTRNMNVEQDLRNMFGMMEMRYERYNKILEEISAEDGCDILLSLLGSRTTTSASGRTPQVPGQATAPTAPPTVRTRSASNNMMNFQREAANAQLQRRMAVPPRNVPPIANTTMDPNAAGMPSTVPTMSAPGRTPTLVIPSDPNRWRDMQRSLVVGGVYHVQAHQGNTGTQYCLWNGTQLVPCRVQNSEVQLDCTQVWLGSLRIKCQTKVRIKADANAGFHFNIPYKGRQHSIIIPQFSVSRCQVCKDNNLPAMFIDITGQFADGVRAKLGMHLNTDPTIHPTHKEERRKRVVLFMKVINSDQWEALTSMQGGGRYQQHQIDIIKALKILADCKDNNKVQQKITDWIAQKTPKPNLVVLENLAKDLSTPEDTLSNDNDDDDDVIMTQEEVGIKCPYTQQVMKDPVRNKICGHNYEKAAIHEFIVRKKGIAKCPYAGCGNLTPLSLADMESNVQLQDYIRKLK